MFNITNDIGETNNLATKEPKKVKSLSHELGAHLRSVNAQMPTNTNTNTLVPWPDEKVEIKPHH